MPLTNGSKLQIKHLSAEKIELVGEFEPEKSVHKRPSVDIATHFQIIKIKSDENQIKVRSIRPIALCLTMPNLKFYMFVISRRLVETKAVEIFLSINHGRDGYPAASLR